jgi:hypothetical protein
MANLFHKILGSDLHPLSQSRLWFDSRIFWRYIQEIKTLLSDETERARIQFNLNIANRVLACSTTWVGPMQSTGVVHQPAEKNWSKMAQENMD